MSGFDYGRYFGHIEPLADALRQRERRVWQGRPAPSARPRDYVLYLGCNVLRTVNLAEAITAVLEAAGVDFVAMGGPANCCGIVHARNGDTTIGDRMFANSMRQLASQQTKGVLTYCPSCHLRMDEQLPAEGRPEVPYRHVTEFLVEHLERLRFTRRVDKRIALHAHHTRPQQRRDAGHTRRLLEAVPGLEVIELAAEDADWGYQCSSQQIAAVGPERFHALADGLFAEARARGADAVVTVYHSCYRELCPKEGQHGVPLLNYVDLLCEGLGLGPFEHRYKAFKLAARPEEAFSTLQPAAGARGVNPRRLRASVDSHFAPPEAD